MIKKRRERGVGLDWVQKDARVVGRGWWGVAFEGDGAARRQRTKRVLRMGRRGIQIARGKRATQRTKRRRLQRGGGGQGR